MKKRLIMCGGICVFLIGVCLIANRNTQEASVSADIIMETEAGSAEENVTEDDTEDDTKYVYFLEEEEVQNNSLFDDFINGKIQACDIMTGEIRKIYDYYNNYYYDYEFNNNYYHGYDIYGIHYMAGDLDGDEEDELLLFVQVRSDLGDLIAFDEVDGQLYSWETWENIIIWYMPDPQYCGDGVFLWGATGCKAGHYNSEGRVEMILEYGIGSGGEDEEGKPVKRNYLTLYNNGMVEKKLVYDGCWIYGDEDVDTLTPENKEIRDECVAIFDEVYKIYPDGEIIKLVQHEDDAVLIPIEELLLEDFRNGER